MIAFISSGFYTSIQDVGRQGFRHLGVPLSGPMDQTAFDLANALLPDPSDQCVFECTMIGPTLKITVAMRFVLTGASIEAWLDNRSLEMNKVYQTTVGSELKLGRVTRGLRTYLRFEGILDLPLYFGSKSFFTPITKQRRLQKGDNITLQTRPETLRQNNASLRIDSSYLAATELAVDFGPDWEMLPAKAQAQLLKEAHTVEAQDRMGYHLSSSVRFNAPKLLSQLVLPGMVQLTPGGKLLVATADCQVTGGYLQVLQLTPKALDALVQKAEGKKLTFRNKPD
jgi:biotin-dependent carboxylase-like uncharacterized protein